MCAYVYSAGTLPSSSAHVLPQVFSLLGQSLTEVELADMFKEGDTDRSGGIDFNEFCVLMGVSERNDVGS